MLAKVSKPPQEAAARPQEVAGLSLPTRDSPWARKHAAGEVRGRQRAAHFSRCFLPSPFPGEFSREEPEEDGRDLFFALKQWRRQRRRRLRWRRQGSCRRGHLSSSSPQRACVLSCPGESRLFRREMRLFWARRLSGTSCCEGGSWPPL